MQHDLTPDGKLCITADDPGSGFDLAALQAKLQAARADYTLTRDGDVTLTVRLSLLPGPRPGKRGRVIPVGEEPPPMCEQPRQPVTPPAPSEREDVQ